VFDPRSPDDDGNVVHEGEMWVKYLDPKNFEIEHVDWRPMYNMLRAAAQCPQGVSAAGIKPLTVRQPRSARRA
jgi:hypothetical protein